MGDKTNTFHIENNIYFSIRVAKGVTNTLSTLKILLGI